MRSRKMIDVRSRLDLWSLALQTTFIAIGFVLAVVALINATDLKFQSLLMSGAPWKQNFLSESERTKQLECLAINVYREAGYEPYEGKVAVAQVTLNRAASGLFPSEICDVVQQKTKVADRTVCQFSWYCDSQHRARPVNAQGYQDSYEAARRVLLENYRLTNLKDALYYHADYVKPNWGKPVVAKIGRHIFYKESQ